LEREHVGIDGFAPPREAFRRRHSSTEPASGSCPAHQDLGRPLEAASIEQFRERTSGRCAMRASQGRQEPEDGHGFFTVMPAVSLA
jgi:hypothetical protein